jgi:hypothetical protein
MVPQRKMGDGGEEQAGFRESVALVRPRDSFLLLSQRRPALVLSSSSRVEWYADFVFSLNSAEKTPLRPLNYRADRFSNVRMSLDTTGNLKQQLINNLGPKYPIYLDALQNFSTGRISRFEFEDIVNSVLTTATLREWLSCHAKSRLADPKRFQSRSTMHLLFLFSTLPQRTKEVLQLQLQSPKVMTPLQLPLLPQFPRRR